MATNTSTLGTLDTAWKGRTGAYTPPIGVLTDQTQLTLTASGDGTTKAFNIAHSLAKVPTVVVMTGQNAASLASHKTTVDGTKVYITYKVAPVSGSSNISLIGMAAY